MGALGTLVFMRMTKKEEPMEAVPDPSVQVENPAADTISISTDLTGTVEPADVVYVAAMGSGEVLEVYVNQGEMVEKDQTLFKIDNKQLESARIQLNTAKVSLDDAQTNLNRMKVLYDSGDISAQAYEQVVNSVSMAKLQYDGAKLSYDIQLENSTVLIQGYCPAQIAEAVGYDSEYSFKRAFVRTVGMAPRDYCAQNGGDPAAT